VMPKIGSEDYKRVFSLASDNIRNWGIAEKHGWRRVCEPAGAGAYYITDEGRKIDGGFWSDELEKELLRRGMIQTTSGGFS